MDLRASLPLEAGRRDASAPGQRPSVFAGASELPGEAGACARVLAPDAAALGEAFRAAWRALRHELTGEDPPGRRKSGWL